MTYVHILTYRIEESEYDSKTGWRRKHHYTEVRVRSNAEMLSYKKYVEIRNGLSEECKMRRYTVYQIRLVDHMVTTMEDDEAIPQDSTFRVVGW